MLATVLHLHRGTPYVYQGEELGMTNAHFTRASTSTATSSRSTTTPTRGPSGRVDRGQLLAALAAISRDNARTPMQWDDTAARRLHHGHPWIAGEPELRDGQRRGRAGGPGVGLPPLPRAHRAAARGPGRSRSATSRCSCPTTSTSTRSRAGSGTVTLTVLGNFSGEEQEVAGSDHDPGELVLGNYAAAGRPGPAPVGGPRLPAPERWGPPPERRGVGQDRPGGIVLATVATMTITTAPPTERRPARRPAGGWAWTAWRSRRWPSSRTP